MTRGIIIGYEDKIPGLPSYYWKVELKLNKGYFTIAYGEGNTISQCKRAIARARKKYE